MQLEKLSRQYDRRLRDASFRMTTTTKAWKQQRPLQQQHPQRQQTLSTQNTDDDTSSLTGVDAVIAKNTLYSR